MKQLSTIVFDLDGTLYQDEVYVYVFLQELLKDTVFAQYLEDITEEALSIMEGYHVVKLGQFVDIENYCIRTIKPLLYREGITPQSYEDYNNFKYMYIGDGWQVCFLIAEVLGISKANVKQAFLNIRTCMVEAKYHLQINEQLPALIENIKKCGIRCILATNTVKEGAEYFLKRMKLDHSFNDIIYDAGKPKHAVETLKKIGVDISTTLSIGDVPFNDLYPIQKQGGSTILISPYLLMDQNFYDVHVSSFEEVNDILKQIIKSGGSFL